VAKDGGLVTVAEPAAPKEPMRSTRPRVNGVLCIIVAVFLLACSGLEFWFVPTNPVVLGPALPALILAIISIVMAVLAFRVARSETGNLPLAKPLQIVTILAVVVGVIGIALGFILGVPTVSAIAMGAGVIDLGFTFTLATQGSLIYGAARYRA
jgi:predicted Abi (CAAX) family protease